MIEFVSKAITRLRNGGPRSLLQGIQTHLNYRLSPYYWGVKATLTPRAKPVEIADVGVDFVAESGREQKRFETLMGERDVLEALVRRTNHDDVVWDVGGSWGMFTVPLAATGADVVVFEPVPSRFERIRQNLTANNLDAEIKEHALGAAEEELVLETEGENPGGLTEDAEKGVTTLVRPGDDVVADGEQPPTVLKIDVEGAEADVLTGLQTTLRRENCRLVVIEVHEDYLPLFGASEDDVINHLEAAEFDVRLLTRRNQENYHIIAEK